MIIMHLQDKIILGMENIYQMKQKKKLASQELANIQEKILQHQNLLFAWN